jgi:poly(3-hydroxybutyrate) depolymerase
MGTIMSRIRLAHRLLVLLAVIAVLAARPVLAQRPAAQPQAAQRPTTGFLLRTFKDDAGDHKYTVFVPRNYTPTKKWPVILFLHGAGERGNDGMLPTTVGIGPIVQQREATFPFVVVFPQSEDMRGRLLKGWSADTADGARALKILQQVEKDYSIDSKREILTGWSMGGYGVWEWAAKAPERWLSVVPISGGGDRAWGENLKNVPIWAWHGAKDRSVRVERSRDMIEAIRAAGGNPRYTEVADGDHDVWMQAYDDDSLYSWMLSPQGDPAKLPAVTTRPRIVPGKQQARLLEPAFIPALDVPRAGYARLGNEMLAALADAVPHIVPHDLLTGRLADISDATEAQGYTFSVYMSGLTYRAQLSRAVIKAYRKDRLNIQLGLTNVQVVIGGTSLNGERHSAQAGPISIVIGHQRPVWLSFDVTPVVVDRKLRFKHVGTAFHIPNDNWYVTSPAGVSTHGFGMTEGKVSSGLVSGLYGKKGMIEQKVGAVVPNLIAELEKRFDAAATDKSVTGVWPIPVYKPRLKVWPAEVSTDESGVSLVLGMTAAAVDPAKPPRTVRVAQPLGLTIGAIPPSTKLRAGVAPDMLEPLSEMLVEADVARINVTDTPSPILAKLGEASVLAEAIPDLARFGPQAEVSTELVLVGPITVVDVPGSSPQLQAPQLKLFVSIKADRSSSGWKPYAEFDVSLRQSFEPKLVKPTELTRAVSLTPDKSAQIEVKGRFAPGYEPQEPQINNERLQALFAAGWEDFVNGAGTLEARLPDVDLGFTMLRAEDAVWSSPDVYAVFGPAGVKLTNTSDKPLVYETKGPYSGWGGPFTLKPGDTHDYQIAYPLIFRRRAATSTGYQMFTLPPGTHSEFRTKISGTPEALYKAREPEEIQKAIEELSVSSEEKNKK